MKFPGFSLADIHMPKKYIGMKFDDNMNSNKTSQRRFFKNIISMIDKYYLTEINHSYLFSIVDLVDRTNVLELIQSIEVLEEVISSVIVIYNIIYIYYLIYYIKIIFNRYIRVKLLSSSSQKVEWSIILLDILIKNCGYRIHYLVSKRKLMKTYSLSIRRQLEHGSQRVGRLGVDTLQEWYQAFLPRREMYNEICKTYEKLKFKYGIRASHNDFDVNEERVPIFVGPLSTEERELASRYNDADNASVSTEYNENIEVINKFYTIDEETKEYIDESSPLLDTSEWEIDRGRNMNSDSRNESAPIVEAAISTALIPVHDPFSKTVFEEDVYFETPSQQKQPLQISNAWIDRNPQGMYQPHHQQHPSKHHMTLQGQQQVQQHYHIQNQQLQYEQQQQQYQKNQQLYQNQQQTSMLGITSPQISTTVTLPIYKPPPVPLSPSKNNPFQNTSIMSKFNNVPIVTSPSISETKEAIPTPSSILSGNDLSINELMQSVSKVKIHEKSLKTCQVAEEIEKNNGIKDNIFENNSLKQLQEEEKEDFVNISNNTTNNKAYKDFGYSQYLQPVDPDVAIAFYGQQRVVTKKKEGNSSSTVDSVSSPTCI
jgi:hypothetical protein